jgi:hypothetical protein
MMSSANNSYTIEELIQLRPLRQAIEVPLEGLLYIVVSVQTKPKKAARSGNRNRPKWDPRQQSGPKLVESEDSFSAASRRGNIDGVTQVMNDLRGILNKVTEDNIAVLIAEATDKCCPLIIAMMEKIDDEDEREDLLVKLAKLFTQKAQVDHAFSKWYAQLASRFTVPDFGDILYEVCRESLPTLRYDPEKKRGYLGSLLLLVELRRVDLVTTPNLEAAADRLLGAIDRNLGNLIMATTTEAPIDSGVQIEVCVELLCKYLPAFFECERPNAETETRYVVQLRKLSENKTKIKPRARFLLGDFFKFVSSQ